MLQTLLSTQKQVPGMHLTTIPKIVLVPRKSHFHVWCYVLDVRILAPPVAKITYHWGQHAEIHGLGNLSVEITSDLEGGYPKHSSLLS